MDSRLRGNDITGLAYLPKIPHTYANMKLLIVEDDQQLAKTVKNDLMAQNNTVELTDNGADGSFLARSFEYDAIILDNSLPKKDGLTICREIRSAGKTTPILFLTIDGGIETKMMAFESGADDYLQKPFSLQELSARLKALSRRPVIVKNHILRVHDLELDSEKNIVRRGNRRIHPTRKEFGLLEYFMKNIGIVLSRAMLMEHVWTADNNPFSNTVEAHITNLRKKINTGNKPNLIANIAGRGYIMDTPENLKLL
ncbi:MAG: response regulator transcription factor [Candidatus Paceibacterota bacterium]|jgi:DNA-binding response OmpR family regulator